MDSEARDQGEQAKEDIDTEFSMTQEEAAQAMYHPPGSWGRKLDRAVQTGTRPCFTAEESVKIQAELERLAKGQE